MAIVKELIVCGACRLRIHDDCLLPEEEREEVIHRLEKIVERNIVAREMKRRREENRNPTA